MMTTPPVEFKLRNIDVGPPGHCFAEAELSNGQVWWIEVDIDDTFEIVARIQVPSRYIDSLADEEIGQIVRLLHRPATRLLGAIARSSEINHQRKLGMDKETFDFYLSKRDLIASYKTQHAAITQALAFLDRGWSGKTP